MKHDFETLCSRKNTGSGKWNMMYDKCNNLPDDIVPFSVADMELKNAPEIIEGLKNCLDNCILGYTSPTQEYFDAVISWMKRRHSYNVEKDWIVPCPGVVPALYFAVRAYTEPQDGVIIMTPAYPPFRSAVVDSDRVIVENPLIDNGDDYFIDFDDLEIKAKDPSNKLLILCSPHNPVGRVWRRDELERVGKICLENDVIVVSDEIHFDLISPSAKHTVLATLSDELAERSVICTAPSKSFNLAGMQDSNIIIKNKVLREKFEDVMHKVPIYSLTTLAFEACKLAYNEAESWLDELNILLDHNRKLCETFVAENIPKIKVRHGEGTYLQWWDCRELGMNNTELEAFMQEEAHLFLNEGHSFGEAGNGFERVNLACPTHVLQAALERLHAALSKNNLL